MSYNDRPRRPTYSKSFHFPSLLPPALVIFVFCRRRSNGDKTQPPSPAAGGDTIDMFMDPSTSLSTDDRFLCSPFGFAYRPVIHVAH